jgi:hypothetical protein
MSDPPAIITQPNQTTTKEGNTWQEAKQSQ